MNRTLTDLAHEIYAAAQTAPGEGIEDAARRIEALLATQQPEPRDAIARSKRILGLVDEYHENPTRDTRTALRVALMDEFQPEPRAEVTNPFRELLEALIDIYDDQRNNAPEARCYVEGAWSEVLDEARALLAPLPEPARVAAESPDWIKNALPPEGA
ncbi:hypothetical protein [Burkholderia cenocepacia]|uniref:hypothetical protein n=1 Tax=Burkholderia cenocepacia TaxID=95486 RepID=UPI000A3FC555|nr:hypothetical protein [Burkholderia cenocepacia]